MLEGFKKIPVLSGVAFMSVTNNGINFNGNVVFRMQKAKYINLLLNASSKQIAIQECDNNDEDKLRFFRESSNWRNGIRFNNREIYQMIARMMNWDLENYNYHIDGIYLDEEKAMVFNLNDARKIQRRRKRNSNI